MRQYSSIHESVKLGQGIKIHEGVVIHSNVVIGDFTEIKPNVVIASGVHIGAYCLIAPNVSIVKNQTHWVKYTKKIIHQKSSNPNQYLVSVWEPDIRLPRIGDHVFIGANTVVYNSVCDNVVIGASSFIKDSIIESGTYQGNPIKKLKDHMAFVHALKLHI